MALSSPAFLSETNLSGWFLSLSEDLEWCIMALAFPVSPLQHSFHLHNFTQLPPKASWPLRPFTQGLLPPVFWPHKLSENLMEECMTLITNTSFMSCGQHYQIWVPVWDGPTIALTSLVAFFFWNNCLLWTSNHWDFLFSHLWSLAGRGMCRRLFTWPLPPPLLPCNTSLCLPPFSLSHSQSWAPH